MIGVIVGNGLLIDLLCHTGAMDRWNPRAPLSWNLPSFVTPGGLFLDDLPRFRDATSTAKADNPSLDDFDAIRAILPGIPSEPDFDRILADDRDARSHIDDEEDYKRAEARHFLVMSFSMLQKYLENNGLCGWQWFDWFSMHHDRIAIVVSFNYDLLIEYIIESIPHSYFRFALDNIESGDIPIWKPHGSIDFTNRRIDFGPITYPLSRIAHLNNFDYLAKWPREQLDRPRDHADLVLPTEYSMLQDFFWNQRGLRKWDRAASYLSSVVIIGLSYWKSDRAELNRLTDRLRPGTRIIMANPKPPDDWCRRIEQRSGRVKKWRSGPVLSEKLL